MTTVIEQSRSSAPVRTSRDFAPISPEQLNQTPDIDRLLGVERKQTGAASNQRQSTGLSDEGIVGVQKTPKGTFLISKKELADHKTAAGLSDVSSLGPVAAGAAGLTAFALFNRNRSMSLRTLGKGVFGSVAAAVALNAVGTGQAHAEHVARSFMSPYPFNRENLDNTGGIAMGNGRRAMVGFAFKASEAEHFEVLEACMHHGRVDDVLDFREIAYRMHIYKMDQFDGVGKPGLPIISSKQDGVKPYDLEIVDNGNGDFVPGDRHDTGFRSRSGHVIIDHKLVVPSEITGTLNELAVNDPDGEYGFLIDGAYSIETWGASITNALRLQPRLTGDHAPPSLPLHHNGENHPADVLLAAQQGRELADIKAGLAIRPNIIDGGLVARSADTKPDRTSAIEIRRHEDPSKLKLKLAISPDNAGLIHEVQCSNDLNQWFAVEKRTPADGSTSEDFVVPAEGANSYYRTVVYKATEA